MAGQRRPISLHVEHTAAVGMLALGKHAVQILGLQAGVVTYLELSEVLAGLNALVIPVGTLVY